MRIAYFSEVYWPKISGVSHTLVRTVDGLKARGHSARVYTPRLAEVEADRPEVHRSPGRPIALDRSIPWGFPRKHEVLRDLKRFDPDIVHLATEFPMGRVGAWAARKLGIPRIASAHTDYEKYSSLYGLGMVMKPGWVYLRRFYANAGRVLCPSRPYEAHLNARGVAHTGIWSRGVDTRRFHPGYRSHEWRARFGIGPDDLLVAYVGRLAPEKNLHLLMAAWESLSGMVRGADGRNVALSFVGDGLMEEEIGRRALWNAHLTGPLEGTELATAYASADVFLFPSSTETFGNCLLEAMASGVPAVAVRGGGVLDYAEDEVNCLLARPDDVRDYARRIRRLLDDDELRGRIREGGLATAHERSWDAVFARLLADYREVARIPAFDHAA